MAKNDVLDLTKPLTTAPVARPAALPDNFRLQQPLPAGVPMRVTKLLPGEQAILEAAGYKQGDPVPENLAEIIRRAKEEATNTELMPPPGDPDAPPAPLQLPDEKNLEDLPEEQQTAYRAILREVLASARKAQELEQQMPTELPDSVRNAVRAAAGTQVEVQNDLESDKYAAGNVPKQPSAAKMTSKEAENAQASAPSDEKCPRCGWFLANKDVVEVTEDDKTSFIAAICCMQPFSKTYTALRGKLVVQVRALRHDEGDLVWQQLMVDWDKKRVRTVLDEHETAIRYRMALQIVQIAGLQKPVVLPDSLQSWAKAVAQPEDGDTLLFGIRQRFEQSICTSETITRLLATMVRNFNALMVRLEASAANSDF